MYADPNRIRNNRISLRFDTYENNLITALAEFKGIEPAVLVREMTIQTILELTSFEQAQDRRLSALNQDAQ